MKKIIDYKLVGGNSYKDLEHAVNSSIKYSDWQPIGSPIIFAYWFRAFYYQAMVKYAENEDV